MRPEEQIVVLLDGTTVPGLLLKWRKSRRDALVTYEVDGRVETSWIPAAQVHPMGDPPPAAQPAPVGD